MKKYVILNTKTPLQFKSFAGNIDKKQVVLDKKACGR